MCLGIRRYGNEPGTESTVNSIAWLVKRALGHSVVLRVELKFDVVSNLGVYVLRVVPELTPSSNGDTMGLRVVPITACLQLRTVFVVVRGDWIGDNRGKSQCSRENHGDQVEHHYEFGRKGGLEERSCGREDGE